MNQVDQWFHVVPIANNNALGDQKLDLCDADVEGSSQITASGMFLDGGEILLLSLSM